MEDHVDWSALARYIAGESPPDEREMLEELIKDNDALQELVYVLERTWYSRQRPPSAPDVDDSWGRMKRRMDVDLNVQAAAAKLVSAAENEAPSEGLNLDAAKQERGPRKSRSRKRMVGGWPGRVAVAFVVALLTFVAVNISKMNEPTEPDVVHMREVATEPAQRATFSLGDGTKIVLNADSRLRVPDVFDPDAREVFLEGEAHFEVAHDSSRPFVVHSDNGRVEVLGTTFALRAYGDEESVQVVVAAGSVAFSSKDAEKNQRVVLRRGQRALLSENGTMSTDEVDVTKYTSWVDGRLVFNDTPLDKVAITLERWYDVEVEIRDEHLRARTVTADLKGKYLVDVLNVLSLTLNIRYELHDDKLVFTK